MILIHITYTFKHTHQCMWRSGVKGSWEYQCSVCYKNIGSAGLAMKESLKEMAEEAKKGSF